MAHMTARLLAATTAVLAQVAAAQPDAPRQAPGASAAASGIRTGADCVPPYPPEALKAGVVGKTTLRLSIDASGRADSAEVLESAGPTPEHKLLDKSVAQTLTGCTLWVPKLGADGRPVANTISIAYEWQLPGADDTAHPLARPARMNANVASCRPVFPPAALRAGAQGITRLRMAVDKSGRVVSTEVIQSAGRTVEHRMLDWATAVALPHCPVIPATDADGHPIDAQIEVSYTWRIVND
jgi:TonB family protein